MAHKAASRLYRSDPNSAPSAMDANGCGSSSDVAHSEVISATTPLPGSSSKEDDAQSRDSNLMGERYKPLKEGRRRKGRMLATTVLVVAVTILLLGMTVTSFLYYQKDANGCKMSYMYPSYSRLSAFDSEHTRFASKYSLYLYREHGVDVSLEPRGVPVLFIPGNAGSYKQVRPIAAEAARRFNEMLFANEAILESEVRNLDFFTVDFNEDITAFHGQTLLDQAEYLNEAITFILSLYHHTRDDEYNQGLPDPSAVILLGHSMGGIVARTMLTMPNHMTNSVNTIITMSTPHALPPVPFDSQMVKLYDEVNQYWRESYLDAAPDENPLCDVTLISIAGGGLDTVVPSDYSTISSLVPASRGFTVFTSSIPEVWTGMDHQAILWCDQFRKVVAGALLDIVDVTAPAQTKPRIQRMRKLRKWFLTGLEEESEIRVSTQPETLLALEDGDFHVADPMRRVVMKQFGGSQKAMLLRTPAVSGTTSAPFLSLITDQSIGEQEQLQVYLCNSGSNIGTHPHGYGMTSGNARFSTARLACYSAVDDVVILPASTKDSKEPFDGGKFSFLRYKFNELIDYDYVAIVYGTGESKSGFLVAEFQNATASERVRGDSLSSILMSGIKESITSKHPMLVSIQIPLITSSLLSYRLRVHQKACEDKEQLFFPLVRQSVSIPHESKFFVNAQEASVNLHGLAPYVTYAEKESHKGMCLQVWSDPTNGSPVEISLHFDFMGSLGKLVMRFRTAMAAFPLIIVVLTMRLQFSVYDRGGPFISFHEALNGLVGKSLLKLLVLSGLLPLLINFMQLTNVTQMKEIFDLGFEARKAYLLNIPKLDLFLGLHDNFFWFLGPVSMVLSVGVCEIIQFLLVFMIYTITNMYSLFDRQILWQTTTSEKPVPSIRFSASSPRRRVMTTLLLLFFVATVVPYQFAYMVACIVQLATCVRALKCARESHAPSECATRLWDFYNYSFSILILMIWILPINMPVLVVWIHNLAVRWYMPFSSHHNVLSIMPFVLLVETLTTGHMIPRIQYRLFCYITDISLLAMATFAMLYGVMYTYILHQLVNIFSVWLVMRHFGAHRSKLSIFRTMITACTSTQHNARRHLTPASNLNKPASF